MRPTASQLRLEGGLGLAPGTGRAVVGPLGLYLGPGDARVPSQIYFIEKVPTSWHTTVGGGGNYTRQYG